MMTLKNQIVLFIFIGTISVTNAQYFYKKASDYGLDQNVKKIIEVTYQYNFDSRKCEEIKKMILEFGYDGKLLSENIRNNGKPSEIINYKYDEKGRLKTIISKDRKEYTYYQKGDTFQIKEVYGKDSKWYNYVYIDDKMDKLNMIYNGSLFCIEEYLYSNDEMKGKTVQFYNELGKKEEKEEHKYKNGRTVFFRKKNSLNDNKTCYYYFNSIDNSLDFEETARPGREVVISKDCNYHLNDRYWVSKSEELFSVPLSSTKLSVKQKHFFYFRKIYFKNGMKIGSVRVQKDFVNQYIE